MTNKIQATKASQLLLYKCTNAKMNKNKILLTQQHTHTYSIEGLRPPQFWVTSPISENSRTPPPPLSRQIFKSLTSASVNHLLETPCLFTWCVMKTN